MPEDTSLHGRRGAKEDVIPVCRDTAKLGGVSMGIA
jgi:hypothetical protein